MSLVFLKNIQSQAVKKKYKSVKMFRLEIDCAPKDLDFFVVDMSHTPIEVESEEVRYGFKKMNFANLSQQVDLTVTFHDSEDERLRTWLTMWNGLMDNGDGTSNPPNVYLKKVRRYRLGTTNPLSGCFDVKPEAVGNYPTMGGFGIPLKIGGYDFGTISNLNQLPGAIAQGVKDYAMGQVSSLLSKYIPSQLMGLFQNLTIGRGLPITSGTSSASGIGGGQSEFTETKTDEWMMWVSRVGDISESREESGMLTFPVTFTGFRS